MATNLITRIRRADSLSCNTVKNSRLTSEATLTVLCRGNVPTDIIQQRCVLPAGSPISCVCNESAALSIDDLVSCLVCLAPTDISGIYVPEQN